MTQVEQAAKDRYPNHHDDFWEGQRMKSFLAGAAYQQEQDEEVIKELVDTLTKVTAQWEVNLVAVEGKRWWIDKAKHLITKYSTQS